MFSFHACIAKHTKVFLLRYSKPCHKHALELLYKSRPQLGHSVDDRDVVSLFDITCIIEERKDVLM